MVFVQMLVVLATLLLVTWAARLVADLEDRDARDLALVVLPPAHESAIEPTDARV